jgi:hypothetical protein
VTIGTGALTVGGGMVPAGRHHIPRPAGAPLLSAGP